LREGAVGVFKIFIAVEVVKVVEVAEAFIAAGVINRSSADTRRR
jgi:hypothetical protein